MDGLVNVLLIILICASTYASYGQSRLDAQVAARFAPVFYQALGDHPRNDYITNFDFDGDWRGDNNWINADKKEFAQRGYIYYAISVTQTHYFIQYAVFHPRDYKGGEEKGRIFSKIIAEGAKVVGPRDPTGLLDEAVLAHENDMEGCLVVVAKNANERGAARVAYVESLAHNAYASYLPTSERTGIETFKADGTHVLLYVEPKGHGIEAYFGDEKQTAGKEFLIYKYTGRAGNPDKQKERTIGYELLPIATTLWPRAKIGPKATGTTYGDAHDYRQIVINVSQPGAKSLARNINLGGLGSAFLGKEGGENMARPPWGWFDNNHRSDPLGLWFFDPAKVIRRDFGLDETFSTTYIRLPFWANK